MMIGFNGKRLLALEQRQTKLETDLKLLEFELKHPAKFQAGDEVLFAGSRCLILARDLQMVENIRRAGRRAIYYKVPCWVYNIFNFDTKKILDNHLEETLQPYTAK